MSDALYDNLISSNNIQDIQRSEDSLASLKEMQQQAPSPQLNQNIARLEKELELYSQEKLCYEAQILRVFYLYLLIFPVIEYLYMGLGDIIKNANRKQK